MPPFLAELLGTMLLVILGDGVVANVVLNRTKGQSAGWSVITAGWAFGVTVAVYAVGTFSGAHLNPAVTIGLASIGKFAWASVPVYIAAQLLGAFLGAGVVWLAYLPHWSVTDNPSSKLAVFCTAPAIRNSGANLLTEIIGTIILVLGVLAILTPKNLNPAHGWDVGFGPCLVGIIVWAIGLSLGGPTGYAINPARDLGHAAAHGDASARQGRLDGRRHRRDRDNEPARNHRSLGSGDGRAGASRHRVAGSPHGRPVRPVEGPRARAVDQTQNRSRSGRLFLRHETGVAAAQCPGRAGQSEGRQTGVRHRGLVARMESHGPPSARD